MRPLPQLWCELNVTDAARYVNACSSAAHPKTCQKQLKFCQGFVAQDFMRIPPSVPAKKTTAFD
jgi:hypothetical protein